MGRSDRLRGLREWARSSLWLLPAVFVLASVALAVTLPSLDRRVEGVEQVRFVFGGGAQTGRSILSVIAGSMVSLVALVFSILIVVFQLTSGQFTPRALRTFLQDRASKIALGVFLATFAYSLTVMRAIREKSDNVLEFVPRLSITTAFVLALLSMGVFVYYIHHVSLSIKLSSILARIHSEAAHAIERLLPVEEAGGRGDEGRGGLRSADDPARQPLAARVIQARRAGYITSVRTDQLLGDAVKADVVIAVNRTVGTFVALGRPLLEVRPQDGDVDEGRLVRMVHLGDERTMEQDLGFGFRQLADIAVRALSPGVNDPTTRPPWLSTVSKTSSFGSGGARWSTTAARTSGARRGCGCRDRVGSSSSTRRCTRWCTTGRTAHR